MGRFWIIRTATILLALFLALPCPAQGIPPKAKVILTMAGYGAVGGALLGVASLAFDAKARAVAQGASLGLYAGFLFGGYIVISHHYQLHDGIGYLDGVYSDDPPESDIDELRFWQEMIPSAYHPEFQIEFFRLTF